MKSLIFAAALTLLSLTKSFAGDIPVANSALRTFQTEFKNVTSVEWSIVGQLYRADFTLDGEKTIAFFSIKDGGLIATSRYISIGDLPRALQRSLKAQAGSSTILELFEVQGNEGLDYYATIKQNNKDVILKSVANEWITYKK